MSFGEERVTKRPTVSEMELLIDHEFKILDEGFIKLVDYMGSDSSIVQAARVSYGAGTKQVSQDASLINYLISHSHTTPFEMCEIKLHIKLPIFVARQWIRHRTASVNEHSARYSIVDQEFYIPEHDKIALQSRSNAQGRGNTLKEDDALEIANRLHHASVTAYETYNHLIELGISREIARMCLPVNFYTEWYWKVDLHNLLHFLKLRSDKHAQYEIRVYAECILDIVKKWVPLTYKAFEEYILNSRRISKTGLEVLKRMMNGEVVTLETSGLSKREWESLV